MRRHKKLCAFGSSRLSSDKEVIRQIDIIGVPSSQRLAQLWDEPTPIADPGYVAILGERDLDEGEKRNLSRAGIMVMNMEQVDRLGLVACMEKALERVARDVDGLYLSFDTDVMDPRHAPGVGTAVPGGLTYREAQLICELAAEFILTALGKRIWNGN